ncbi:HAD family hydrolase [Paenibacillus flagellatus]|uniref:Haloacid dehalogenase n=1 Tax=Paenibacillus flagellatus TaxID=2211139 RepID=A0A2V5K5Q0_9BACL|nr:HAD hydrolase-like protein [Paenibacillus flagellatus]PYI54628.1 haloacid dehalogenase [Paenibacillus flagellatus]
MKRKLRFDAIMFDMDNTLLRSAIDFPRIKHDVFVMLTNTGLLPAEFPVREHTIATLIETARRTDGMSAELEAAVWDIVVRGEREGMAGAGLEPYVPETLERLHGTMPLTVLTNNAQDAALDALERTGIIRYFDHVACREQMEALKPSPSGARLLLARYPAIPAASWLSVGDSWIDGKAAGEAGVPFLAYRADPGELERRGVAPIGHIRSMRELFGYLEA